MEIGGELRETLIVRDAKNRIRLDRRQTRRIRRDTPLQRDTQPWNGNELDECDTPSAIARSVRPRMKIPAKSG